MRQPLGGAEQANWPVQIPIFRNTHFFRGPLPAEQSKFPLLPLLINNPGDAHQMPSPYPTAPCEQDSFLIPTGLLRTTPIRLRVWTRRHLFKLLAATGVGTACFQRALAAQASQAAAVTPTMVQESAWIADLELSDEEISSTTQRIQNALRKFRNHYVQCLSVTMCHRHFIFLPVQGQLPVPTKPDRQIKPSQQA